MFLPIQYVTLTYTKYLYAHCYYSLLQYKRRYKKHCAPDASIPQFSAQDECAPACATLRVHVAGVDYGRGPTLSDKAVISLSRCQTQLIPNQPYYVPLIVVTSF